MKRSEDVGFVDIAEIRRDGEEECVGDIIKSKCGFVDIAGKVREARLR